MHFMPFNYSSLEKSNEGANINDRTTQKSVKSSPFLGVPIQFTFFIQNWK